MKRAIASVIIAMTFCAFGTGKGFTETQLNSRFTVAVPKALGSKEVLDFKSLFEKRVVVMEPDFSLRPAETMKQPSQLGNAVVSRAGATLDIFLAPKEKVKALSENLLTAVSSETVDRRSILSDIQKAFQNQRSPTVTLAAAATSDLFGPVSLVSYTAALEAPKPGGPNIIVTANSTPDLRNLSVNETIATQMLHAQSLARFDASTVKFLPNKDSIASAARKNENLQPLAQSYRAFSEAQIELLKSPADDTRQSTVTEHAKQFKKAYSETWNSTTNDPAARKAAATAFNALAGQPQLKAIYGVETNFTAPSYQQIYNFSRRVVRIRAAAQSICSGIAIDRNWIATAGHCLKNLDPADLEVVFDLNEVGGLKRLPVVDVWPAPAPGSSNADNIDYVFMKVQEDTAITELFQRINAANAPVEPESLCIRSQPLSFKEPVFAIGYPRGESKTVHDHSYVWFPFKVSESDYEALEAETYARAKLVGDQYGVPDYAEEVLKRLRAAYATKKVSGGITQRLNYTGAVDTVARPSFGIDTDTFQGNSGSPVFDRRSRCLVGIFSGGARDQLRVPEASWKQHEFAVPMTEVMAHVRTAPMGDATKAASRIQLLATLESLVGLR